MRKRRKQNQEETQIKENEDSSNEDDSGSEYDEEEERKKFKPGSIMRLKLANFLTYSEVEYYFGPRLNMVCGPNGTGKSTVLCAICLGLGGSPVLLGRADDVRTFIKHEKTIAEIEIELAPHNNDVTEMSEEMNDIFSASKHVIRRVIDRNKGSAKGRGLGSSIFYINGNEVSIKKVQRLVTELYGISVGNLCTFLPQDKVGSFSGFSPKMLLEETCKALSKNEQLYNELKDLIQLEQELKSEGNVTASKKEKLKELEKENEALEREKDRMEERKQAEELLDKLKKKLAWLRFDAAREETIQLKKERDEKKKEVKEAQKQLLPLEASIAEYEGKLRRFKQGSAQDHRKLTEAKKNYEQCIRNSEEITDGMDEEYSILRNVDLKKDKAEQQVEIHRKALEHYEKELESLPRAEEIDELLRQTKAEFMERKRELQRSRDQLHQVQDQMRNHREELHTVNTKVNKMNDEKARRKENIFRKDDKLCQTYLWLEQNRNLFRRQVWGPICLETTVKSLDVAACLEQHVSNSTWRMYVVECQEDYYTLYRELREKRNLPVNIQIIREGRLTPCERPYSQSTFKLLKESHGVKGYLDELFTAPDPILQALRISNKVQSVLVGTQQTQQSMDNRNLSNLLSKPNGPKGRLMGYCIFTAKGDKQYKYTSNISKYSGKSFSRIDDINPARRLAPGFPPEQRENLLREQEDIENRIKLLQPQIEKIQNETDEINLRGQECAKKKKEYDNQISRIKNVKFRIENTGKKLEEAERAANDDFESEKKKHRKNLKKLLKNSIDAMEKAAAFHDQHLKIIGKLAGIKITEDGFAAKLVRLREELNEKNVATARFEAEYNELTSQFKETKARLERLKIEAMQLAPILDKNGRDLPLKEELDALEASTLQEVNVAVEETQLKLNTISHNPGILRQYEARKQEIEELRNEIEQLTGNNGTENRLNSLSNLWTGKVKNIEYKINIKFSSYMADLGCAGEVKLKKSDSKNKNESENENERNYKDWGMEMLVKFRENTSKTILSAQSHSGGERSVATIMYLMALQDLMVSPFRCVDEINQGLDDRNERLVFLRIVKNSTDKPKNSADPSSHSGQYFLITPKLLPNMEGMENEDITINCVMNGIHNFNHYNDWKPTAFLAGRKRSHSDVEA